MKPVRKVGLFAIVIPTLALAAGAILALGGCAGGTTAMKTAEKPMASTMAAKNEVASTSATAGAVQECATCAGKGMAPMVKGTAVVENGVQVVRIGIKDGYYSPNMFMVKAGMPVKAIFSGEATECLAAPTFPSLNKKGDLGSGTATVELGTLKAGTYEFACGMKMTDGKIVVQ
jgi:plastocyanin domain-containing protein